MNFVAPRLNERNFLKEVKLSPPVRGSLFVQQVFFFFFFFMN